MAKACEFCGTTKVITRFITVRGAVRYHPAGGVFVFCPNRNCPRK